MTIGFDIPSQIGLAYTAYFIGTASPGPSNFAIMGVAMKSGRVSALVFATGVLAGSAFWGVLASLGVTALLSKFSSALVLVRIAGGSYLLWLASRSAFAACSRGSETNEFAVVRGTSSYLFLRGMTMHITNPKAILVWLSIITLGLPTGATIDRTLAIVAGCWLIGFGVFGSYALLFSTTFARQLYKKIKRYFEGSLALLFCYAGIRLLLPTSSTH